MISDSDDLLLYTLTAAREMDWRTFKRVYDTLYLQQMTLPEGQEPDAHNRWRTLRMLDALGHLDVEFAESGGHVFVAPAALVRLPMLGLPAAVLCGARGPETVADLKQAAHDIKDIANIAIVVQEGGPKLIPRQVIVETESQASLFNLARVLGISYIDPPPARGILEFTVSLQEYLDNCSWSTMQEVNWVRRDFDPSYLQFRWQFSSENSVRLSSYEDPIRQSRVYVLSQQDSRAQVDLDWGRYAVLRAYRLQVLLYDRERCLLAVPASTPLPRLLARALALCSGCKPREVDRSAVRVDSPERRGYDIYSQITPSISRLVAAKLGQTLVQVELSF